ncbi:GTPase-associated system all-helical protein GASH [Pseudomonas sp. FP2338]|uniref:GTPase-associated system all-helical protein GASH n=1 Tax=Pseudomonas sp. FP2338 TaxID=2954093 RepID=UPI002737495A|nr:GTPase-associated system all-helical protein GASH [Pseudomonas sp. FP2338]WLH84328.1 GTPase-associated system all-helical protein GASH [Pseudomonas sp. FP2338]
MAKPTFADRYAEAGLNPTSQTIIDRSESMKRIVSTATSTKARVWDLAGIYFEVPDVESEWFRDELIKEDASFSLVNNGREARILAAIALEELIESGKPHAILSILTGSLAGTVRPSQGEWLIGVARSAQARFSVSNRSLGTIETTVTAPGLTKSVGEEVELVVNGEMDKLAITLGKMRTESHSLTKSTAAQVSTALTAMNRQMRLMREESQILWWLFGEYSRDLDRPFANLDIHQAAIAGAIDLATLTTVSTLGPIAAPTMLQRVLALAKKPKGQVSRALSATIDSFSGEDLNSLNINTDVPVQLVPISTAIDLARTLGPGAWHARFKQLTGLDAGTSFEPVVLAEQLYREHLLGQLL